MSETEILAAEQYKTYIYKSRYARWLEKENRRENWDETVDRYMKFFEPRFPDSFEDKNKEELMKEVRESIFNLEVMPSMRALMTAGKALEKDHMAGYNCSYVTIDDPKAFDESLYISCCGTGVGFSVERQYVNQLPTIAEELYPTGTVIKVKDSKIGWATAFRELISLLYSGKIPTWDVSGVRPKGAPLKTFGGRASGPEPLEDLFRFTIATFKKAAGRKLSSIECHDLMCKIADIVVSGGVRRSAMISLSNLSDDRMRNAKNGQWWETNGQRALANNSVAYTEKPEMETFIREWLTLIESKSGERGLFNRVAAQRQSKLHGRRKWEGVEFGTNPCSEINLRPYELCNLSEVIIREHDTVESLKKKIRVATIIGTLQSTLTNFRYVRNIWKRNCDEERLLGVSLTGIMDNKFFSTPSDKLDRALRELREYSVDVNKRLSETIGINTSVAITCVKPSGTVSQRVDSSSGIHPRYSPYYIRTVRNDRKDPMGEFLKAQGVPCEPDITKPNDVDVFSFPIKSPKNSVFRDDRTAIEQLEFYLTYKHNWCEHNPSITIYVKESEWLEVGAWVYKHFDEIGGVSFLPHSDHVYKQAPYQEITEEQYKELIFKMPLIQWDLLPLFEKEDSTDSARELACSAATGCEWVGSAK